MKLLKEPLVHFMILGAALFVLFRLLGGGGASRTERIVVTEGQVQQLAEGWSRTWQRSPTAEEMNGLIEDFVREEILYREALALGLDKDDTIIRRVLRQKMEFLAEDILLPENPPDDSLRVFLAENADRFRVEPRISFRHVYLSPQRRNDVDAEALVLLEALERGEDPSDIGDPFPLPTAYESATMTEVGRLFGEDFALALDGLPSGAWSAPVASGYGFHLVRVDARHDGRVPELEEVRDAVRREWFAEKRIEANDAFHRKLSEKYTVTVEYPENWTMTDSLEAKVP